MTTKLDKVTIVTGKPTVELTAELKIIDGAVQAMEAYYKARRPDICKKGGKFLPHDDYDNVYGQEKENGRRELSDNEIISEIYGRSCYHSFYDNAGRKTNKEYLDHIFEVNHASVTYHGKISFFIGGISRRVAFELIRTYVGADREVEGSPSQESTRFTQASGFFIAPPRILDEPQALKDYQEQMQVEYNAYLHFIGKELMKYENLNKKKPKGLERKKIYEAASYYLPSSAETALGWTTNVSALAKQFMERSHESADLEYQRLAYWMMKPCISRYKNLFSEAVHKRFESIGLRWEESAQT